MAKLKVTAAQRPSASKKSLSNQPSASFPTGEISLADSLLLARVRAAMQNIPQVVEKKMFGGTAFLIRDKMCVTVRNERIMCRIDPEQHDQAIQQKGCETMVMKGREYRGFVIVKAEVLPTDKALQPWIQSALDYNQLITEGGMAKKTVSKTKPVTGTAATKAAPKKPKAATTTAKPKAAAPAEKPKASAKSSQNKTTATQGSVASFLAGIADEEVRADCKTLVAWMGEASKCEAVMWGSSIIGFGSYHYKYDSGREGDNLIIGFAPRKKNIALYLRGGLELFATELAKLGKHEAGKGCLYIQSLKDVDAKVMKAILAKSFKAAH
jgi:TfoX/Sxy family transcriptional regulator of competence genes